MNIIIKIQTKENLDMLSQSMREKDILAVIAIIRLKEN